MRFFDTQVSSEHFCLGESYKSTKKFYLRNENIEKHARVLCVFFKMMLRPFSHLSLQKIVFLGTWLRETTEVAAFVPNDQNVLAQNLNRFGVLTIVWMAGLGYNNFLKLSEIWTTNEPNIYFLFKLKVIQNLNETIKYNVKDKRSTKLDWRTFQMFLATKFRRRCLIFISFVWEIPK